MKVLIYFSFILSICFSNPYKEITNLKATALYRGSYIDINLSLQYFSEKDFFSLDYSVAEGINKINFSSVFTGTQLVTLNSVISNYNFFVSKKPKAQEDFNYKLAETKVVSALGLVKIVDGEAVYLTYLAETSVLYNLVYSEYFTNYTVELFLRDQIYYCDTLNKYMDSSFRCPSVMIDESLAKAMYNLTIKKNIVKALNMKKTDTERMIDQLKINK